MKITKTDKLTIEKILGWKPGKEMLLMIMEDMKSGMSATEAASRYAMPPLILCLDGETPPPPDYPGQRRVIVRGPNDNETNKEK